MPYIPPPTDGFVATLERCSSTNRARWISKCRKRIYEWDSQHGELEAYNKRGKHVGVVDNQTGEQIKDPVPGRRIDV